MMQILKYGSIFNDLMSYAFRKNDYNSGTQLNVSNFTSLYGLLYFDLSYQKEVGREILNS